jgi:hypothetical protein
VHDVNDKHRKHVETQGGKYFGECILAMNINSNKTINELTAKRTMEGISDSLSSNLFTGALSTA